MTEAKPKKDFWCVVVLDENGQDWVVKRSPDAVECDVLMEFSGEDNGMDGTWAQDMPPGVYRLALRPWGHQGIDGEWDCGIDVVRADQLFVIP